MEDFYKKYPFEFNSNVWFAHRTNLQIGYNIGKYFKSYQIFGFLFRFSYFWTTK